MVCAGYTYAAYGTLVVHFALLTSQHSQHVGIRRPRGSLASMIFDVNRSLAPIDVLNFKDGWSKFRRGKAFDNQFSGRFELNTERHRDRCDIQIPSTARRPHDHVHPLAHAF